MHLALVMQLVNFGLVSGGAESIFMVFFILLDMGVSSSNIKFFRGFFFVFCFSLGMWVQ